MEESAGSCGMKGLTMENQGLYEVVKYPDRRLRETCAIVEAVGEAEKQEFARMYLTMKAYNGVGFAAPQAGIMKNMFVAQTDEDAVFFANTVIERANGFDIMEEGCLSVPGEMVNVERPYEITVTGLNLEGQKQEIKATGLLARVIQHEMDHLKGRLIIDYKKFLERAKFEFKRRFGR
jgi:peptide deformylase